MTVYKTDSTTGLTFGLILTIPFTIAAAVLLVKIATQGVTIIFVPLLITGVISCLLGYFTYASSTLRYSVSENQLTIKCGFTKRTLLLANIQNIEVSDAISAMKMGGFSWPGFHFGGFNISGKKNVNLYSSRLSDVVFIKYNWETIGISPKEPKEFIDDLNKRIPMEKHG